MFVMTVATVMTNSSVNPQYTPRQCFNWVAVGDGEEELREAEGRWCNLPGGQIFEGRSQTLKPVESLACSRI